MIIILCYIANMIYVMYDMERSKGVHVRRDNI